MRAKTVYSLGDTTVVLVVSSSSSMLEVTPLGLLVVSRRAGGQLTDWASLCPFIVPICLGSGAEPARAETGVVKLEPSYHST